MAVSHPKSSDGASVAEAVEPPAAARREQRELGSVGNALRLLEALSTMSEAGVSELSRLLGLSKPAIDRLLTTLMGSGYAEQDPDTRKYRLTIKVVAIADAVRSRITLRQLARPYLVGLAERTRETVNLGVYSDGSVMYLDKIPSQDVFRIEIRPGTMLPAYCTALGKAMLAHMPEDRVAAYLERLNAVSYTALTTVDAPRIRAELAEVRRLGYAVDEGEILPDVCCVATPILDRGGEAIAAVSVTMPASRFAEKRDETVRLVMDATQRIEASTHETDVRATGALE